jgi:DNA repair protein RecN (Recombination protein N)
MLVHLSIRDLAVVEALDLEFESGLTVLTGETGAGKSILLTALGLALGDRADSGFIRPGATRAEINLAFDLIDSPAAIQWLNDNELTQDNECLIRRIIGQDGRSKAFVNGRPVTLQALQELGAGLVEIHGQHAHVRLLKAAEQRRLLDEAAQNQVLVMQTEEFYRRWRSLREELERCVLAARNQASREELLRYQIEELEQHDIADLDYSALVEEHTLQANIGKILETGQSQLNTLYEDEHRSVTVCLAQAIHALEDVCQLAPEFQGAVAILGEAQVQVKEASLQLRRELESLEADPSRLEWLELRLADIHRLARKHQRRPEELPEHLKTLRDELDAIAHSSEVAQAIRDEFEQITAEYRGAAEALSERRRSAAMMLQERISSLIRDLGMPQGNLLVQVHSLDAKEPTPHGFDQVEFLVSANPGLPPRPLAKVASGGELSRISLAIQVAAIDSKTAPTLIFDEVDTGVGGRIAEIIGQKLRLLGREGRQVFCVTHLPQVAVQGQHHLLVEKVSQGDATQTFVRPLSGTERKQEVARMLGGIRVTQQTLAHAEEMLRIDESKEIGECWSYFEVK